MAEEGTYQVARTPGCVVIKGIEGCPDWFSIPVDGPDYLIGTQVDVGESDSPLGFAPTGDDSKVISRSHVAFKDKDGVTYVIDLASTNGTELNGKKLTPGDEVALQNNDEIYLAVRMIALKFKEFVVQEQEAASVGQPGPEKKETSMGLFVDVAKHEVCVGGNTVEPRIQMHEFELLASLYEAGTAVSEAVFMAMRITRRHGRVVVLGSLHPEYQQVLETYLDNLECQLEIIATPDGSADVSIVSEALDETTVDASQFTVDGVTPTSAAVDADRGVG